MLAHLARDPLDEVVLQERHELALIREVGQGGQEGGRAHRLVAAPRHQRQREMQRGAGDCSSRRR